MKMQTASANHVSMRSHYSQSFFKTIKCAILLLVCTFILTHRAAAQTRTITGTVKDSAGAPLPGASVVVKATKKGTLADDAGRFTIDAPVNAVLVITAVGYTPKEVNTTTETSFDVQMSAAGNGLNEVVVVAYGTQRRSNITGSVTSIKASEVKDQPVTQFAQSIQGKTPGVQINQTTGTPGQGISFRIRGTTSFTGSAQPLFVVDGIPLVSNINNINPEEIETFNILKDASATALYGSRAANGVVIITTKHAKAGQTTLNFDAFYGVQTVPERGRPDVMNAEEFAQYEQDVFNEKIRLGQATEVPVEYQNPSSYRGKGTNWYNLLLQNAPIQSYNFSLSSGTDKLSTNVTFGALNQEGVLIATNYRRYSVRANSSYKFNDKITIGLNVAPTYEIAHGTNTDGNIFGGGIIQNAITTSPIAPYKNPDGSLTLTTTAPGLFGNPNWYRVATETKNNTNKGRLLSSLYGNLEIIKDLNFRSSLSIDYVNEQNKQWYPSTTGGLFNPPPVTASASQTSNIYYSWTEENTLTYKRSFGNHNIDALVGYTAQKFHQDYNYQSGYGFPNDNISSLAAATQFNTPYTNIEEWSLVSFVSRLNYNYKEKYLISASFRRDGSSRFAPNRKYGNFPAVSVGWNVSDENFMSGVKAISALKIRASYGLTGNFNIGNYSFIPNTQQTNYAFNNNLASGISIANIGNNDLSWEKSKQLDIGIDLSILHNRVSITYDYFHSNLTDFLFNVPVARESGFDRITSNVGNVEFHGHEFAVTTQNLVGKLKWTTNANISFSRNKVVNLGVFGTSLPRSDVNNPNIITVGHPIGAFYGYKFIGIYENQADFDKSPKYTGSGSTSDVGTVKYADINGDGVVNVSDQTYIGDPTPDFTYGMTNTLSYNNFDFSVTFSGAYGGDIQNRTLEYTQNLDGVFNVTKDVANRWKSESDPGDGVHPRVVVGTPLARFTNSRWVSDGSYLTVKNVALGYTLPISKNSRYVKGVRIYVSGQQLLVITKYFGANPEVSGFGNDPINLGIDNTSYPVPRTISAGVNITLR